MNSADAYVEQSRRMEDRRAVAEAAREAVLAASAAKPDRVARRWSVSIATMFGIPIGAGAYRLGGWWAVAGAAVICFALSVLEVFVAVWEEQRMPAKRSTVKQ